MAIVPTSAGFALYARHAVDRVAGWVGGFTPPQFLPEQALDSSAMLDARLKPQAAMSATDIDTKTLADLGSIGLKRGKLVSAQSHPELMARWQQMAARAGLEKTPQLIICESNALNALTLSKEEVTITTGLLKILTLEEACGVLGHELGHAQSDHLTSRVMATGVLGSLGVMAGNEFGRHGGANMLLGKMGSKMGVFKKLQNLFYGEKLLGHPSSTLGSLMYMGAGAAVGSVAANHLTVRPTELDADRKGAMISGDPQALASALGKLQQHQQAGGWKSTLHWLSSGYPSTQTRIEHLRTMAAPAVSSTPVQMSATPGAHISQVALAERVVAPDLAPAL